VSSSAATVDPCGVATSGVERRWSLLLATARSRGAGLLGAGDGVAGSRFSSEKVSPTMPSKSRLYPDLTL